MSQSRIEIMIKILEVALNEATKTKIALTANLREEMVQMYLGLLQDEGLLEFWPINNTYKTTDKGRRLIRKAQKVFS
ncbi:MAG: winged helix-turn-helix domain-containing protein [Halobacteriota archaeon]|nr:winged helix-turn-helix domain-containing protein [Halobacteriota archaeon]